MTTPLEKPDFILGYALAFGLMALLQAVITVTFAVWVCGLEVDGPLWQLGLVAIVDALLGTALGLLASAFAQTEFQAVQFMPLLVFPQIILGGLFMPLAAAELRDRHHQRRRDGRRGMGRLRSVAHRARVRRRGAAAGLAHPAPADPVARRFVCRVGTAAHGSSGQGCFG
jgi:hypothetical protein